MTRTDGQMSIANRLAAALHTGAELDLIPNTPVGDPLSDEVMRGWGPDHEVDAEMLRELLLRRGLGDETVDPHGLHLRGARIRGRLDLDLVDTLVALRLYDCLLELGVSAEQAHLPLLALVRCRVGHPNLPALLGDALQLDGQLQLDGSVITATSAHGAVRLLSAQIGSQLNLVSTTVRNSGGPALAADGLQIGSDARFLEGFTAEGSGGDGAIRLHGARIGGQLNFASGTVRNSTGPALYADRLQTDGDVYFFEGFTAEGSGEDGAIRLPGARIGGELTLQGATVRNSTGPALYADGLQTGSDVYFFEGFTAEASGGDGAIRLPGARIGGQLNFVSGTVRNSTGPALYADRLQTDGDVHFFEGFTAEGAAGAGAICLFGARIGGQLTLQGATLRNPDGPAFVADRLQTDGDVHFIEGFTAEGAGENGAVRLPGARIGGQLALRGAIRNTTGPALYADRLQTHGDAFLDTGFDAEGAGGDGALRMPGARIGGQLSLRGATVRNSDGPALRADGLQTDEDVYLDWSFTAEGAGDEGAVRLQGARIGGRLSLAGATVLSSSDERHRWEIGGLTYTGVPRLAEERNRQAWLELLRSGTPRYAAQPYQQLAAAYRAEGHDSDVRAILIAQREDQIARGGLSRADRWWGRITGALLGYGYQPWRALLYLGAVLAVSVTLTVVLGAYGALTRTPDRPVAAAPAPQVATAAPAPFTALAEAQPCPLIERIGKGLDLGTPFLPRTMTTRCEPTSTVTGTALTLSAWLLQVAAWALAALFVAGFTGIVRRT
ncbi:hypothetical protein GCM10010464_36080 [Pseudonocardia yunnanensis]|uniref:Oxidoreductase n=1 Tax=Pseudonocardia yunnanensis TaxID=58107 RepID=A0ABW4EN31_9PSEU